MRARAGSLLFALLCVAQLVAVSSMIVRYEGTLRSGTPFKVEVAPVDPADAFRGRYVAIRPTLQAPVPADGALRQRVEAWGQTVHVTLEADPDGFARGSAALADPPDSATFLTAKTAGLGDSLALELPFDRYYMEETVAPAAEAAYRDAVGQAGDKRAWIVVRVKNGLGVVEGLYIDGQPIEQVALE